MQSWISSDVLIRQRAEGIFVNKKNDEISELIAAVHSVQ